MSHIRPYDFPPPPTDLHGSIKCARWNGYENATLIRMVRKIAFDAGYTVEGTEEFERFHEIDLMLTCILDRVTAQAEMLDGLETHLDRQRQK